MNAPAKGEPIKEFPVKILLLGPPEIYINAKPAAIKRRLNRALFFYLAAQRRPVSRDELCDLFWPEESEKTAHKNLRESLSRIRTGLGVNNLLITNGEQVSLNRELVKVDYLDLEKLIAPLISSSEMNSAAALPDWMVIQLKAAMAIGRTNRFMQGLDLPGAKGYENWVEHTNQAYHYARTKVYDRLIDHFISTGNLEEALLWLSRVSELNPLDENNNYLTLICLRDSGKNQELIDFAGYLENLYDHQQEPFPEKFNELRKQAIEGKAKPDIPGSAWPNVEKGEPAFIGREEELETLSRALRRPGILLLEGEAGVGKTRLMKQFFEQQPFSPRLFYARGHPLASQVPFYAIISAVREQLLDAEWQALDKEDQERLSYFYHTNLQAPGGAAFPRAEAEWLPVLEDVFLAFTRLVAIAAARRPLLFILDDAISLDQASIFLISHLIENGFFEKYGLLVVIASHEADNISLNLMLQRVRRERRLDRIQIPPFTEREMKRFIEISVGREPENEAIEIMSRLSGGNPYFLTECVRSAKWTIRAHNVSLRLEDCSIPESVAALVREKVNRLEPDSAQMIKAAAILGQKFCPDVLEDMTGFDSAKITAGSEELIQEGFLKINHEIYPLGGYEFKHDVEREVLLENMTPSQRRELHLKAAKTLEKRRHGIPRFSATLAQHYENLLQQPKALDAWLEAGRYARAQYLLEETRHAYGNALQLIKKFPRHFEEEKIMQVVNEWGSFAHDHDNTETGIYVADN
jgi:DNA-binding SARP family transcriptional activator/AAA+ ATPase superfamily predicted ATPase